MEQVLKGPPWHNVRNLLLSSGRPGAIRFGNEGLGSRKCRVTYSFKWLLPAPCQCSGLTIPRWSPCSPGHVLLDPPLQSGPKRCPQYTKVTVPHLHLKPSVASHPPWFKSRSRSLARPPEPHKAQPRLGLCPLPPPTWPSSLHDFAPAVSSVWTPHPHHHVTPTSGWTLTLPVFLLFSRNSVLIFHPQKMPLED